MNRVWSPGAPSIDRLQVLVQSRLITASKCISTLALSWPPSVSPNSLDYGLQVRTIKASKCISKLARSRLPSLHNHGLHVAYLQTRTIMAPGVSPNRLDYGIQVCTRMASKCFFKLPAPPSQSASLSSLDHGLQVYLWIHSITASKCISKLTRSQPRSISLSSLDPHFRAHLKLLSSTACSRSRYSVCR